MPKASITSTLRNQRMEETFITEEHPKGVFLGLKRNSV
jgi:hypothetical protein